MSDLGSQYGLTLPEWSITKFLVEHTTSERRRENTELKVLIAAKAEGRWFHCLLFLEVFTKFGKYFHESAYENQNSYNLIENNWKGCTGLLFFSHKIFVLQFK